jgi:tetratricopeptide (TPR) repeat protein
MKSAPCAVLTAVLFGGCSAQFTHVQPGQSAMFARAQKAEFVAGVKPQYDAAQYAVTGMSPVEPSLPVANQADTVNDYYALGTFCLQQERNKEAAAAFQKAVELDPTYADAWNNLAICYQNEGDSAKALEAFKKYKTLTAR